MRRKDREITSNEEIIKIINKCKVLRMALNVNHEVYIVPLNFGFTTKEGQYIFYVHSAKEGKKIDGILSDSNVCIEADCSHELMLGKTACEYGYKYESVIGWGKAQLVQDSTEKIRALMLIMKCQTGDDFKIFKEQADNVSIIKITVDRITAKSHL